MTPMPPMPPPRRNALATALRWAAFVVVLVILARTLAAADLRRAFAILASAGPLVPIVFVPFALALALDTAAFRIVFRVLGHRLPFWRMFPIRITAEAVIMTFPGGVVFAETLNPILLERRCGVPISESVVAGTTKWCLLTRAQAMNITIAALVSFGPLARASHALIGSEGLPWLVLATALVPLTGSLVVASSLVGGTRVERIRQSLRRIPIAPLRKWLDAKKHGFMDTDAGFGRLRGVRAKLIVPMLFLLGTWLLEGLETVVILRVLGADVGVADVIGFEAAVTLLRNLAFFAPAGLGVQDLGYLAAFQAMGIHDAPSIGAAFVVVKRAKEIVWIVLGYVLLFFARRAAPVSALSFKQEALP